MAKPILKSIVLPFCLAIPALAMSNSQASYDVADINWQPCEEMPDTAFQCATYTVPMDHQNPNNGQTVDIALARLPAGNGENKQGSIFLNPGGPGGSGVDFVLYAGEYLYSQELRENYDLVGFDPRGIARSTPITCFKTEEELEGLYSLPGFPINQQEYRKQSRVERKVARLCRNRAGDIMNHMSTADVARDMDILREAVGDKDLNYVGISYGTYLGATYANLFPEKVGAMVIDGVLDPVAWSTGRGWESFFFPVTTRLKSHIGAQDSLDEFFRTCEEGGIAECAMAGDTEWRYYSILEELRNNPFEITYPDGYTETVTYADALGFTLGSLYSADEWSYFAEVFADLENMMNSSAPRLNYEFIRSAFSAEDPTQPTEVEQPFVDFASVLCSDSDNPYRFQNWPWAAELMSHLEGPFAELWTWSSSICQKWHGSQDSRFAGDFSAETKNPVLILTTLYDPATPYHGAEVAHDLLADSRLVTVNGWGHAALFQSYCADDVVSEYFVNATLPQDGLVCDPDTTPFNASLPMLSTAQKAEPSVLGLEALSTDVLDAEEIEMRKTLREKMKDNVWLNR